MFLINFAIYFTISKGRSSATTDAGLLFCCISGTREFCKKDILRRSSRTKEFLYSISILNNNKPLLYNDECCLHFVVQ